MLIRLMIVNILLTGWKREIYYRNLPEGSKSKPAYVSYFSPQGKKFKTIRHIVEDCKYCANMLKT